MSLFSTYSGKELSSNEYAGSPENKPSHPTVMPHRHNTALAMSNSDDGPEVAISAGQKMLSAISGSVITSLLVTPLDVVRVRLQSQATSTTSTPFRSSSFLPSASLSRSSSLGVTACCREVFWVSNDANFCLVSGSSGSNLGALAAPVHTTTPSAASCAVEETQRKSFTSTMDGLQKIARNEGLRSLWRGLSPTLMMAIPGNVIYFAGYDTLRSSDRSPVKKFVDDQYAPLIAGSIARVAAAVVVSPIEMFRTRMQAASGSSEGLFRGTLKGLQDMVKAQGLATLWRGLTLTMWRDVPFSGFYWWGYETVRDNLTRLREERRGRRPKSTPNGRGGSRSRSQENYASTFIDSALAGAASGAVASFITTPFDVGKTRQQIFVHANDLSNGSTPSGSRSSQFSGLKATMASAQELMPEERSMPRFLYHIFKTEGLPGLFKGWAARCLKVAPACAIMISSYEIGKKTALSMNERKDGVTSD